MDDKWFKAQQKKVGKTAEDIAKAMGRSRSNVSHILSGRQRMSLDWAKAFSTVLEVPVGTILEKAGAADPAVTRQLAPGFAESDAVSWSAGSSMADAAHVKAVAAALGGARAGVDIWKVKSRAMSLAGLLEGDFLLVDTLQAERARTGDVVISQIYNNIAGTAVMLLRRLEPPVLVAASADPDDSRVHVVDGTNVVIFGKVIASWRA